MFSLLKVDRKPSGIVEMDGELQIVSFRGKGTVNTVILPLIRKSAFKP